MNEQFIVIPNWDRYQHYKGQERPAWIKLHASLIHDDGYLDLTPEQRSALVGIWILYAESGRKLSENTWKLSRQLGQRITKRTLKSLSDAGFIQVCSREALEKLYSNSSPRREEKIREEQPSIHRELPQDDDGRTESDLSVLDAIDELRKVREAMA